MIILGVVAVVILVGAVMFLPQLMSALCAHRRCGTVSEIGAGYRTRTCDLLITNQMLYQPWS